METIGAAAMTSPRKPVTPPDKTLAQIIETWPAWIPTPEASAIRDRLAERITEIRRTAKRWNTESREFRIDRAIAKHYGKELDSLANLLEQIIGPADRPAGEVGK